MPNNFTPINEEGYRPTPSSLNMLLASLSGRNQIFLKPLEINNKPATVGGKPILLAFKYGGPFE